MSSSKQQYRSNVYQHFKEIGEKEYQSIVRFFEEHEKDIQHLSFEEYFELLMTYTDALFEIGAYPNYVETCDFAIESTIHFNVKMFKGVDVYQKLLFRKAASLFQLMRFEEAKHILRELIRINPDHELAPRFLKKCRVAEMPKLVQRTRAASLVFFILSAIVIAIEQFYIKTLLPEYNEEIMLSRNLIFIIGLLIWLGGELLLRYKANRDVDRMVLEVKKRNQLRKKVYE